MIVAATKPKKRMIYLYKKGSFRLSLQYLDNTTQIFELLEMKGKTG